MKAVGQFAGGISAFNAGKYTRDVMKTNAQNALNAGVAERDRVRTTAGMAIGQQIVDQGGSGFQPGTGSALEALRQSAINRELDLATSRTRAGMTATNYLQQGKMAYAQGKSAEAGGIISGAATIAQEIAQAFGGGGGGGAGLDGGSIATDAPDFGALPTTLSSSFDMSSLPGLGS